MQNQCMGAQSRKIHNFYVYVQTMAIVKFPNTVPVVLHNSRWKKVFEKKDKNPTR